MNKLLISVLGQDRPGIIALITKVLFEKDFNIEDVSQTILQNEFSGIFIATGPEQISSAELHKALVRASADFDLHFYIRKLSSEALAWTDCDCEPFVITTRGPDRKGLVSQIAAILGGHNVNVTQLQAVFRGGSDPGNNIMIYEVDIPSNTDQQALRQSLQAKTAKLYALGDKRCIDFNE